MTKKPQTESPLVCNLNAMNAEQRDRHQTVAEVLLTSAQEITELPNGYALHYPSDSTTILLAAEFMTLERLCCPFLDFALKIDREGGPLSLQLTGREGVKELLWAELGL